MVHDQIRASTFDTGSNGQQRLLPMDDWLATGRQPGQLDHARAAGASLPDPRPAPSTFRDPGRHVHHAGYQLFQPAKPAFDSRYYDNPHTQHRVSASMVSVPGDNLLAQQIECPFSRPLNYQPGSSVNEPVGLTSPARISGRSGPTKIKRELSDSPVYLSATQQKRHKMEDKLCDKKEGESELVMK